MLRAKVERCRETYEAWLDSLAANSAGRDALTAYDAAQVALGKEWRAVEALLMDIERAEMKG